MSELIDLTLTLGSDRISLVPGLVGVEVEPIQTHASHARSNQKLCLATHIGTHLLPNIRARGILLEQTTRD